MQARKGAVVAASWQRPGRRHRERPGTLHGGEALVSIVFPQPGSRHSRCSIVWMAARLPGGLNSTKRPAAARRLARLATASPQGTRLRVAKHHHSPRANHYHQRSFFDRQHLPTVRLYRLCAQMEKAKGLENLLPLGRWHSRHRPGQKLI